MQAMQAAMDAPVTVEAVSMRFGRLPPSPKMDEAAIKQRAFDLARMVQKSIQMNVELEKQAREKERTLRY